MASQHTCGTAVTCNLHMTATGPMGPRAPHAIHHLPGQVSKFIVHHAHTEDQVLATTQQQIPSQSTSQPLCLSTADNGKTDSSKLQPNNKEQCSQNRGMQTTKQLAATKSRLCLQSSSSLPEKQFDEELSSLTLSAFAIWTVAVTSWTILTLCLPSK